MANDFTKFAGITFKRPPNIRLWWEPNTISHRLADGAMATYKRNFTLKGEMEWGGNGWCSYDDWSNIAAMYNQLTATAVLYPRPDTQAARKYNVHITNSFEFVPYQDIIDKTQVGQSYQGTITFESSIGDLTATCAALVQEMQWL